MEKLKAQWKDLPPLQRYGILFILPIAIMAYIYIMLITPTREELEKSKKDKDQLISQIEELKRLTDPKALDSLKKKREELEAQLVQKQQELERVVGEIPSKKDVGTVYRRIGLIAKKNGVVILSATLGVPSEIGYDIERVEGGKVMVKIVRAQEQPQQQQQQRQQPQQQQQQQQKATPSTAAKYPTAELKLSFIGTYSQIISFLNSLEKEGFVSYPSSMRLSSEGNKLRGEITLFVLMKEES